MLPFKSWKCEAIKREVNKFLNENKFEDTTFIYSEVLESVFKHTSMQIFCYLSVAHVHFFLKQFKFINPIMEILTIFMRHLRCRMNFYYSHSSEWLSAKTLILC